MMEVVEPESLLLIKKKNAVDSSGLLKSKLQHLKGEYKKWKQQLLDQWTKHNLLATLATGEHPDLAETETQLKSTRQTVEDAKSNLQDVITTLQELIEQAECCFQEYEDRLKVLNQEKENYNELTKRHQMATAKLNDTATRSGLDNTIKEKEKKLAELQLSLDDMNGSITKLEAEIEANQKENVHLQNILSGLKDKLKKQEDSLQAASGDSEKIKWLEDYLRFLREISGIKKVETDGTKLSVWLTAVNESDTEDLCVTMNFGSDSNDKIRLQSAEISNKTLEVDDIIKTAVLRDEAPYLIGEVKNRWTHHLPLYKEVEKLRHQYAIDWLHDERIIKVIYGADAHVICTLNIDTNYPGENSVKFVSVEGINDGPDVSTLRPPTDNTKVTLTQWLDFLNDYFREQ